MGGGASKAAAIGAEREKAAREIAAAREAAAAQENRVDELQSQLESERARSAGLEIQLKQLEAGACSPLA
jgi:chromosome segregation ATPase